MFFHSFLLSFYILQFAGVCLKNNGTECDSFSIKSKLEDKSDLPLNLNVTTYCEVCESLIEDDIDYEDSSHNGTVHFNFINCTMVEMLVAKLQILETLGDKFTETIVKDISYNYHDDFNLNELNKFVAPFNNYHKKLKLLSTVNFFILIENLTVVRIENKPMEIIPSSLFVETPNAAGISLLNDSIRRLSVDLLRNLSELQGLDLSHNEISTIPLGFFRDSPLQYLWLSHNKISNLSM